MILDLMQRLGLASGALLAAALVVLPPWIMTTSAQTPGQVPFINFPKAAPPPTGSVPPATGSPKLNALEQRDQELQAIRDRQKKVRESEEKFQREIERIGDDRRKLNRQIIDVAARVRTVEHRMAATEQRLAPLDERERKLRASLDARRHVIGNVLAALQRIGRNPPPAMLVTPEDALQSVRSAILFGAVLPGMRRDVETLATDLSLLASVRKEIATERGQLEKSREALENDQSRLTALTAARQKQQAEIEKSLLSERERAAQLARQSEDVQALIGKLEQGLVRASRAARSAARSAADKKAAETRPSLAALKDPGRLAPAIPFARAKGTLPLPVNGVRIRDFGRDDGVGGQEKGLSIAARPGAQITAPCDGWVVYAGPFRNYGQLLILNAGGGYHVLLAGMERISVDLGQFVVTGEPVAVMGGRVQAPAAIATGSGQPVLYVEFRKDGTPVDSGPWWAASDSEKVRG
jgi:septal ring factor EnvC (AmiA/AmiB activator)